MDTHRLLPPLTSAATGSSSTRGDAEPERVSLAARARLAPPRFFIPVWTQRTSSWRSRFYHWPIRIVVAHGPDSDQDCFRIAY